MSDSKTFGPLGVGELRPGVVDRRYLPEGGMKKLRTKIDSDMKASKMRTDLPFEIGKPKKPRGRNIYVKCDNCGSISVGTTVTVGKICSSCNKYSSVTEVYLD